MLLARTFTRLTVSNALCPVSIASKVRLQGSTLRREVRRVWLSSLLRREVYVGSDFHGPPNLQVKGVNYLRVFGIRIVD